MNLIHKPDWEETKERYLAWWAGESLDRCALAVYAPRDNVAKKPIKLPDDPVERWTNLDLIKELNEDDFRNSFYGGEAFPIWSGGYPGHTSIPAFLGCPVTLTRETGWWDPILTEKTWNLQQLVVNKEGFWWKFTLKLLQTAAREARGKAIPSIGAFGGCGDTLAALRGTNTLLTDLYDCPEKVRETELYLMDMWIEIYREFYAIIQETAEGSAGWFQLWSPGKFYAVQNDFSYMISPEMFQEIFLPAIEKQLEFLDHAVYHVDGIEAFRHIPTLCELPRLQAIQVLPGAGKPSPLHYLDTLKYIQKKKKSLHISIAPEEVETALANLSSKGLFILTSCRTQSDAEELLKKVKIWSRD
ncbi:MAG: hypothetical protein NTY10_04545 [Candidatus Omnitrophica bacterium]|nr:hypothetical protein [Candidatus Omnitrophota bacterium]